MRRSFSSVLLVLYVLLVLSGCATAPPAADIAPALDLSTRAMLLYLVDRQQYEPVIVQQALAGGPELREALADALGRIPDKQGRSPLVGLLLDDVPAVRRAAAFGLGELEDPEA